MPKTSKFLLISLLAVIIPSLSFGQNTQIVQSATFATDSVSMWGLSSDPVLDDEISLFHVDWNEGYNSGSSGIFTIIGQSFGAGFQGNIFGQIGSKIRLENFTSGLINVEYPIEVTLDLPQDNTYDQGDQVTVATSYEVVDPDWLLETVYPGGEIMWDVYFQMGASASVTACFFGCLTFPIIPSFDTGLITINLVTISSNGASTGGETGIWFLGPGAPPPYIGGGNTNPSYPGTEVGVGGWPFAVPISDDPAGNFGLDWIPWQCYTDLTLEFPDNDLGIYGELTLPYVETDDTLLGQNLQACGESTYITFGVEIFDLLGFILQKIPPLAPVGLFLVNLSGEYDPLEGTPGAGIISVNWNFFSASIEMNITNKQCFTFDPKIYGSFEFPFEVNYDVLDPAGNFLFADQGNTIDIEIGQQFRYKYPCYYEEVSFVPTYTIDGLLNNHTYDEIAFSFEMSAFEFGLEVSAFTIIPGFTIPSWCFDLPYPCPTWDDPFEWCSVNVCTPEIVIPPVGFDEWSFGIGPLWEESLPIGSITYDWFNDTWSLPGFESVVGDTIFMKAEPLWIENLVANVSCFGLNDGSIDITTGALTPALPMTYTWTNGANTEDLSNLTANSYQVSVIDANGCQMFTGGVITEPLELSASSIVTDKSCNGGVNDGQINLSVTGGNGAFGFAWSNGMVSEDIIGLDVGAYTVDITDANNCALQLTATVNQPSILGQNGLVTDVNCNAGIDGQIDVTSFGGTLPYAFAWSNTFTTEDITGVASGIYTLTVTDAKNCTSIQSYNVGQPAQALQVAAVVTNVNCFGDSTGNIDITTSGGTPGYTFSWSNGNGIILPVQTEDLTNVPASAYQLLVFDARGCSTNISQTITQPAAALSSTPLITEVACFGDASGSINPSIIGGTQPYIYNWSNGTSLPLLNNAPAGPYTLLVTDNNLCQKTFSYVINQPNAALAVNLNAVDVLCFGQSTGSVTSTVSGGTPNYSYLWNNGSTSSAINGVPAANYSLTVTDVKLCTATATVDVLQPAAPLSGSTIPTHVNCFGDSTGSIDLTVNGGTFPYTYVWNTAQTLIFNANSEDVANLWANSYSVTVTDAHGCEIDFSENITQPLAPLSMTSSVDDVNCYGINDGGIDITVAGGTPVYTFNWSNGSGSEDLTSLLFGDYDVTVTDALGCSLSQSFQVSQPNAPLGVSVQPTSVKCAGGNDGSILSFVSGGTQPYNYAWSSNQTTTNIQNLTAGVYSLTVTDDQGCTAFTGTVVSEPANPLTVSIDVTDPTCFGYSDGQIVLNVSGGTQPYYFNWGNENEILLNNPSETLDSVLAATYLFRIEDENGCLIEQLVSVNQPTPLEVTETVTNILCYGDSTGMIDLTVNGATPPYTTAWSNGQTTEDASMLPVGTYDYTVTDSQNCESRGIAEVTQPSEVKIDYTITNISCIDQADGQILVGAYGGMAPYSYSWNSGQNTPLITGLTPGTYTVTISDANNCASSYDLVVQSNAAECVGIPNTITPNGDNYNDTWILENIDLYPNAQVSIFNKWGNLLYETKGTYTPWDGTHHSQPLPSEVYYYIIRLGNTENNEYTGTITIVR
jgi:gliding motility-associated-like protein